MIDEVCSRLDHPAGTARGAKAAAFAGEGNEVLVAAGVALDAQEAVFEQTALQVIVELPLDECRERSAFGFEPGEKPGEVSLDDSVERCLFRTVAFVDIPVSAAGLWQSS